MLYLIYKTTNLINNKIYIGKHKTDNIDDDYLGSGTYFNNAVKKYGRENFQREILFECKSEEEMNQKEFEIVNQDFVNRSDTYNLKVGGDGGFDFINHNNLARKGPISLWKKIKSNPKRLSEYLKYLKNINKKYRESLTEEDKKQLSQMISKGLKEYYKTHKSVWIGYHHKESTRKILSNKMKNNPKIIGNNNGMYGKRFIHNIETKKTEIISKNDPLPIGFKEGRYIKYNNTKRKIIQEDNKKLFNQINTILVILFQEWRKYCNEHFKDEKKSRCVNYKTSKSFRSTIKKMV